MISKKRLSALFLLMFTVVNGWVFGKKALTQEKGANTNAAKDIAFDKENNQCVQDSADKNEEVLFVGCNDFYN